MIYHILIIGGARRASPPQPTAAGAGKSVLILEKETFGGQITWSPKVENFPGFVSISGAELGAQVHGTGHGAGGSRWNWRRPSP
ncbi:MAG: hypothetical protein V8T45_00535 [Oscillospiraceae bacterium]